MICSEDLGANRMVKLPASPAIGDQIDIKMKGAGGFRLHVEKITASHLVDGGDSIVLESDYAAIKLVYVANNDWRVF